MRVQSTTEQTARQAEKITYGYSPDPCPRCGVRQAQHWKCANCGARGHEIPRDTPFSAYCRWCADEARQRAG